MPSTEGPDRDRIDAAIWWDVATYPGAVIPCRALAVVRVDQNPADSPGRIRNDRVLAVPVAARREVALAARVRQEIEQFFIAATVLEGKEPRILGWDNCEQHWSSFGRRRDVSQAIERQEQRAVIEILRARDETLDLVGTEHDR